MRVIQDGLPLDLGLAISDISQIGDAKVAFEKDLPFDRRGRLHPDSGLGSQSRSLLRCSGEEHGSDGHDLMVSDFGIKMEAYVLVLVQLKAMHVGEIRTQVQGELIRGVCRCGYVTPWYPQSDRDTVWSGLRAHAAGAPDRHALSLHHPILGPPWDLPAHLYGLLATPVDW